MAGENDALDAMSSEFIAEIKDDLAALEPDLLAMEAQGADTGEDLINHAFRSIHSIKGGAGFINFKELSDLSHVMESVLMRVREKKLVITSGIVDALLSGLDAMKAMVENIGPGKPVEYDKEKHALKTILESGTAGEVGSKENHPVMETGSSGPSKTSSGLDEPETGMAEAELEETGQTPVAPAFKPVVDVSDGNEAVPLTTVRPISENALFKDRVFHVAASRLEKALKGQKYLYAVSFDLEKDLEQKNRKIAQVADEVRSIGDILYADDLTGTQDNHIYIVVATILDLPLIIQVLEVEDEKVSLLDRQFADIETILKGLAEPGENREEKKEEEPKENRMVPENLNTDPAPPSDIAESMVSGPSAQTVRINVDLISRLMNRAGELVLSRNQLRPVLEQAALKDKSAGHMMQNLDMVTGDLQEAIMQMRMQPVIDLLGKYRRVVRDISRRMDKKVEFIIEGADVEVDRNVLEKIANPVTHLIRNSIDHGIEYPQDRARLGKPETGIIRVSAFHQGGHVHIIFSDDGAGIDPQLVMTKAYEKGLVSEEQLGVLTDKQKINLIFTPGFSTSESITDISGRGVGLDVVKNNIERLRGQIEIDSRPGEGTRVRMIIPLTLSIVPSLIVRCGEEKFAIPQVNIKEVIYLEPGHLRHKVEKIGGGEVLRFRDELMPIVRLRNVLGMKAWVRDPATGRQIQEKRKAIADRRHKDDNAAAGEKRSNRKERRINKWDETYIVIARVGQNRFGLCVDGLFDIEEVVVEPLCEYIKDLKCYSGASILGDGSVIMILDTAGIAASACLMFENIKTEEHRRKIQKDLDAGAGRAQKRDVLVFSGDGESYFAFELADIRRLEPLQPEQVHSTGRIRYVEYNRKPVMLMSMDEFTQAGPTDPGTGELYALFPKKTSSPVGILATSIVDTFEIKETLEHDSTCPDVVMGKVFIEDRMIQVLDHGNLVKLIEKKISQAKERT